MAQADERATLGEGHPLTERLQEDFFAPRRQGSKDKYISLFSELGCLCVFARVPPFLKFDEDILGFVACELLDGGDLVAKLLQGP